MKHVCYVAVALVCLIAAPVRAVEHQCVHDKLEHPTPVKTNQVYVDHAHDEAASVAERRRRLATTVFEPIRIKVVWGDIDSSVTAAEEAYLKNTLVPAAVEYWQEALEVDRVDGNLFAHRTCQQYWSANGKCQQFASSTTCDGEAIPDSWLATEEVCPSAPTVCTTESGGSGVPNTDFILMATAKATAGLCDPGGSTVAYATWCQMDQFNRPTIAHANWCPDLIKTESAEKKSQISVATHEIAHALGFTSQSFPYFRDELGNPRTPRDSNGNIASSQTKTFSCNSNTYNEIVPSTNTVEYFAERGHDNCQPANPTSCVMKMVTPKVKAVTQSYFGCTNANLGAELENQPTTPCTMIGSHWEARLFMTATMAAFTTPNPKLLPMTLALFEDSGWYKANYSMANRLQVGVDWGFQQGCAFALDYCVAPKANPVSTGAPAHFCADISAPVPAPTASECTLDRSAQAYCQAATYNGLPSYYQYFSDSSLAGGFEQADYCPYRRGFSNRLCTEPSHAPSPNYQGQGYSANSMCFESTLRQSIGGFTASNPMVGCYSTECMSPALLKIHVERKDGTTLTVECTDGATTKTVSGFDGSIRCLDPAVYCAPKLSAITDPSKTNGVVWLSPGSVIVSSTSLSSIYVAAVRFSGTLGDASVRVVTRNGTAMAGVDFEAVNTTLSWPHGDSGERLFSISILSTAARTGQTFYVDMMNPVNLTMTAPMTAAITLDIHAGNGGSSLSPRVWSVVTGLLACLCAISAMW